LFFDAEDIWLAFLDLHSARMVSSHGVYPISFVEIEAWLNIHGIDGDYKEEYTYCIRKLDQAYLDFLKERQNADT